VLHYVVMLADILCA